MVGSTQSERADVVVPEAGKAGTPAGACGFANATFASNEDPFQGIVLQDIAQGGLLCTGAILFPHPCRE